MIKKLVVAGITALSAVTLPVVGWLGPFGFGGCGFGGLGFGFGACGFGLGFPFAPFCAPFALGFPFAPFFSPFCW